MKNYIIPYGERKVITSNIAFCRKLMIVDNVGLVVVYQNDEKPTVEYIRKFLIGWNEQNKMIIQAENIEKALLEFYNFPECKTGFKHKAWEIINSKTNPIIEYEFCKHMNFKAGISCTRYDEPNHEYNSVMICILDGLDDPPLDCPINNEIDNGFMQVKEIGGIWLKQYGFEFENKIIK